MARQESIKLFTGCIGELCFYKTSEGYFVRPKGGHSRTRIMSDPSFKRVRENINDFSKACKATKLFRRAFRPWILSTADARVTGRLTASLIKIIKSDATKNPDERRVNNGNAALIEGFNLNKHADFDSVVAAQYTTSIDRAINRVSIDIEAFSPKQRLAIPKGATHFRINSAAATIDFETNSFKIDTEQSEIIEVDIESPVAIQLRHTMERMHNASLFVILGIEFFQRTKSELVSLRSAEHTAAAIVRAEGPTPSRDSYKIRRTHNFSIMTRPQVRLLAKGLTPLAPQITPERVLRDDGFVHSKDPRGSPLLGVKTPQRCQTPFDP